MTHPLGWRGLGPTEVWVWVATLRVSGASRRPVEGSVWPLRGEGRGASRRFSRLPRGGGNSRCFRGREEGSAEVRPRGRCRAEAVAFLGESRGQPKQYPTKGGHGSPFLLALGTGGVTSSFLGGREGSWHRRVGPREGKEVIGLPTC